MKALRIGICVLAAFTVLAFGTVETWSESILEAAAAILFLWWAILIFARRETEVRWSLIFWPVLAFVGIGCLQLAFGSTAYPFLTRVALLKISACFLVFFLSVQAFQTRQGLRFFAWFLMCFGFGVAVLGIAQNYTSHDVLYWFRSLTEGGSPFGPYVDRDHFAGLMELIVPMGMSLVVFRGIRREQVLFVGVLTLVPATALILTTSRGGIASFVFEVGLLAALTRLRRRRFRGAAVAAISLGVLASVAWLGTGTLLSRIKTSSIRELSRDRRVTMVKSAWHMFLVNPWMGAGLGTLVVVYPKYETFYDGRIVDHVHNDYVEVLAEMGIAGGICGLTFLVMLFREGADRLQEEQSSFSQAVRTAGMVGCAGLLVHSLVDFNLHIPANGLFFLLLVAIVISPVFGSRKTRPDDLTRLQDFQH